MIAIKSIGWKFIFRVVDCVKEFLRHAMNHHYIRFYTQYFWTLGTQVLL
jgi:hypothetical protein